MKYVTEVYEENKHDSAVYINASGCTLSSGEHGQLALSKQHGVDIAEGRLRNLCKRQKIECTRPWQKKAGAILVSVPPFTRQNLLPLCLVSCTTIIHIMLNYPPDYLVENYLLCCFRSQPSLTLVRKTIHRDNILVWHPIG